MKAKQKEKILNSIDLEIDHLLNLQIHIEEKNKNVEQVIRSKRHIERAKIELVKLFDYLMQH
jgi:hypothetical protein